MKKILDLSGWCVMITLLFLASSCYKWDKPTPPRELAPAVFKDTLLPVKFGLGFREVPGHYDSLKKWVPKQFVQDSFQALEWKRFPIKDFEVMPNGDQVMKMSYWSGYGVLQFIGLGLIAFLIVLIFKVHIANDHNTLNKAKLKFGKFATPIEVSSRGNAVAYTRIALIIMAVALGFLTLKPSTIARNNAKTITEYQLKHYQAIDSSLNYFWDSVFNKGAIIGGKTKK